MRQFRFIFLFLPMVLFFGCNNWDITNPGPQPIVLENTKHQPKLNVLGILRPDSEQGISLSFVHVEISFPINDYPDSAIVTDADVKVLKIEGNSVVDSANFIYSDFGVFPSKEYRNQFFKPQDGTYQLICQKQDFPILTAQAKMVAAPKIEAESFLVSDNTLSFKIIRNELVALYEVVLQGNSWVINDRFLRHKQGNVSVEFPLNKIPKGECLLKIFAFDNNLSEYFTANLSIKPNIFQKDFSTVENGYGCFGTMNVLEMVIEL